MYRYILFDLDGTLTDSCLGITNCVKYSLEKLGERIPEREVLLKFIGPPLIYSFAEFCGLKDERLDLAVRYYRERYEPVGVFENEIYDGIKELLEELKNRGKKVLLATSKPQKMAEKVLEYFGITKYFDIIVGSEIDGARKSKSDVIRYAIENMGVTELSEAVMVGDRNYDILGAKENGIKSIGVLYGYGDTDELETAGADYIAENPLDLLSIV